MGRREAGSVIWLHSSSITTGNLSAFRQGKGQAAHVTPTTFTLHEPGENGKAARKYQHNYHCNASALLVLEEESIKASVTHPSSILSTATLVEEAMRSFHGVALGPSVASLLSKSCTRNRITTDSRKKSLLFEYRENQLNPAELLSNWNIYKA